MWLPTLDALPRCPPEIEQIIATHGEDHHTVYRAPRIQARFQSIAHHVANLELDRPWGELSRLARGGKPITFWGDDIGESLFGKQQELIHRFGGGATQLRHGNRPDAIVLSMTGIVGERIDVEAAISDWSSYLNRCHAPGVLRRVEEELRRIATLRFDVFSGELDVVPDTLFEDPGAWARCGLLLGYPIATTAAIVGRGLGLDGGFAVFDVISERLPVPELDAGWMSPGFTGTCEEAAAIRAGVRAELERDDICD